jgi:hypothetical protein
MKTGFDFTDPYKLLTSVGLVLISISIILPWLLLQASFDTLLPVTDIAKLTPIAQDFINQRQFIALWLINNVLWISGIGITFGLSLFCVGLALWYRRHKQEEEIKIIEENKRRREANALTPDKLEQFTHRVIEELYVPAQLASEPQQHFNSNLIAAKYREIKNFLGQQIRKYFTETHYLGTDQHIGKYEYLSLRSRSRRNPNAIIKITYVDQAKGYEWFLDLTASTLLSAQIYEEEYSNTTYAVIVFVLSRQAVDQIPIEDFRTKITEQVTSAQRRLKLVFWIEDQLESLNEDDFAKSIFSKPTSLPSHSSKKFFARLFKGNLQRWLIWAMMITISTAIVLLGSTIYTQFPQAFSILGLIMWFALVVIVTYDLTGAPFGALEIIDSNSGRVVQVLRIPHRRVGILKSHFLSQLGIYEIRIRKAHPIEGTRAINILVKDMERRPILDGILEVEQLYSLLQDIDIVYH